MTAELQFLTQLLRLSLGTGAQPVSPPEGIDWAAFAAVLDRHRVGAFLVRRLPEEARLRIPPPVAARMAAIGTVAIRRAMLRTSALRRLVALLEAEGVAVTSIKGPLLARELYGNLGGRHAGDLDLLIDAVHLDRADTALRREGWRRVRPDFDLSPWEQRLFRWIRHEYVYADPEGDVHVDLIWRLFSDRFTAELLHEPARVIDLAGRPVRRPARDTEALYLFIHGARHGWLRLFWLLDVALLLADPAVDWDALLARARGLGVERAVRQGARLASELLLVRLPAPLLTDASRSPAIDRLVRDGYRHIESAETDAQSVPWRIAYHMRRHDRWTSRADEFGAIALSPLTWRLGAGSDTKARQHYALRPLRWLHRAWRGRSGRASA